MRDRRQENGIKRTRRRNFIIAAVEVLGIASVFAVGFSAWTVIRQSEALMEANIAAAVLSDESVTIKQQGFGTTGTICFGANKTSAGNEWLTNNAATEDLSADFTLVFSHPSDLRISLQDFSFVETNNHYITLPNGPYMTESTKTTSDGITKNGVVGTIPSYVASPSTGGLKAGEISFSIPNGSSLIDSDSENGNFVFVPKSGDTTSTIVIQIRFSWGPAFNYQNPMDYYSERNLDWGDDFDTKITTLSALNACHFALRFSIGAEE